VVVVDSAVVCDGLRCLNVVVDGVVSVPELLRNVKVRSTVSPTFATWNWSPLISLLPRDSPQS